MKTHTQKNEMTFIVPSETGELVEFKVDIKETKQIKATVPMLKEIEKHCTPVALATDYNLLVLNL